MSDAETSRKLIGVIGAALLVAFLAFLVVCPQIDLFVSGLFYHPGESFFLDDNLAFVTVHQLVVYGSRVLGVALFLFALVAYIRHKKIFSLDGKAWLFLFFALMFGPILLANVVLKDHWGRARPHSVTEFGGTARFTPAFVMADECRKNCSFVSGDGSFGFFLPAFAYVVSARRRRAVFWTGMAAGAGIGFVRIAMGAHFFSDVIYAAVLMLAMSWVIHTIMYGFRNTASICKTWIICEKS